MKGLPEKSVDLVVTSPPYNLGIGYGRYNDQRPEAKGSRSGFSSWSAGWSADWPAWGESCPARF
jgi:DNA modification methylase